MHTKVTVEWVQTTYILFQSCRFICRITSLGHTWVQRGKGGGVVVVASKISKAPPPPTAKFLELFLPKFWGKFQKLMENFKKFWENNKILMIFHKILNFIQYFWLNFEVDFGNPCDYNCPGPLFFPCPHSILE